MPIVPVCCLGIDVSPLRLGWGLVSLDDGTAIACGMERIDLPHKGWMETQITEALKALPPCHVAAVYMEDPHKSTASGGQSAFIAGRAIQAAHTVVRKRWPEAPVEMLQPSEWRRLAEVPPDPREGRKTLKGMALRDHVVRELDANGYGAIAYDIDLMPVSGLKPWVMATAMIHGFLLNAESPQDAADAAMIALAGQRRNVENWQRAVDRGAA